MTILVLCSRPECQTTAGCKCSNVLTFDGRAKYRGDPTYHLTFSTSGMWARKQWPDGQTEDVPVEEVMRAFDRLTAHMA